MPRRIPRTIKVGWKVLFGSVWLAVARSEVDQAPPRMPEEQLPTRRFDGIAIPLLALDPHAASAPIKVEKALALYGLAA